MAVKTDKTKPLTALLVERRAELGLTQEQAANKIGVSTEEFARWERGTVKTPRVPHRLKIAEFLGLEIGFVNAVLDDNDVGETEERLLGLIRQVLDERD